MRHATDSESESVHQSEKSARRAPSDLVLSQVPEIWGELFAAIDITGFSDDFLADRDQGSR